MSELHNLKLHERITIDEETKVLRVPGYWIYCINGQNIPIPLSKEFNTDKKQPSKKLVKPKQDVDWDGFLTFWNSIKAVRCNEITEDIKKLYCVAEKKHSKEEITTAIIHYGKVLAAEDHFFSTKWPLSKFLKQGNCIPDFLNNGDKWVNFNSSPSSGKYSDQTPERFQKND